MVVTTRRLQNLVQSLTAGFIMMWLVQPAHAQEWAYTVRPGDNLWNLSGKYLKRGIAYTERLRTLNAIDNPRRLKPGSKVRFPIRWLKVQPVPVSVLSVSGEVKSIAGGDGSESALQAGAELEAGDQVITGPGGNAVLQFADGSKMVLRADSLLTFDSLTAYGDSGMVDTRARLQRGRIDTTVERGVGPGSHYEIETPAAVSAVRGTDFRVSAEAENPVARTEVLTGAVVVSGSGWSRQVPEKFGIVAETGKPPRPPRALLPAPDTSGLPTLVERDPVRLTWPAVPGAQAYRMQVAKSEKFENLVVDKIATDPSTGGFSLAEDGDYFFRVRGIDEAALEGLDGRHEFTLNARPEPPFPVQPPAGAKIHDPQPEYQWTKPVSAVAYRFQLANDREFSSLVEDQPTTGDPKFKPATPLEPGRYYWRLATKDKTGETGPFSDPQELTYKPLPPSPQTEPPTVGKDEVAFRWTRGVPNTRYHFQLARDPGFADPVIDERLIAPEYRLSAPKPGTYYMRVATIDPDGTEGTFGQPQEFFVPSGKWWAPIVGGLMVLIIAL